MDDVDWRNLLNVALLGYISLQWDNLSCNILAMDILDLVQFLLCTADDVDRGAVDSEGLSALTDTRWIVSR